MLYFQKARHLNFSFTCLTLAYTPYIFAKIQGTKQKLYGKECI